MFKEMVNQVFDYQKLLEDAKKEFADKAVESETIFKWFREKGLTDYIYFKLREELMFRLRQDLWKHKGTM